ncbi:MAG: hypothetical protein P8020_12760 [Acidobacteriota bacterium]
MRTIWRLSLLVVLLAPVDQLYAVHPTWVTTATAEEFFKGDFDGVSLTSDGRLLPAPAVTEVFNTEQAFVHSAVVGPGGAVYIGTGANGKVFRLDPAGKGSEWAKLDEPAVYAMAVDSKGRIYAGTSPGGKVYRFAADGKPEVFFDPDEKFIWDLLFDDQDNLYVATGPKGIIYKVSPSGEGKPFFDSHETHIVKLAWDLEKNLLAGSAPKGLLFRIDPSGKAYVLYDSSLEEMKAIAVDRYGNIYAAALSGGPETKASSETAAKSSDQDSTEESKVELPRAAKGAKLEVYRIDKEGLVETLYSSTDELVFDILVRSDGNVLFGTGNEGRVLMLTRKGFVTLLADTREEQVTRLLEQGGQLLLMTSNLGKVYRLGSDVAKTGTFESDTIDAGMVSHWGTISWRVVDPSPSSTVKLYTRSGNTETPDDTWADWSVGYTKADGSAIASVPARFLQFKVEFTVASGQMESVGAQQGAVDLVRVSYQQANMAPKVSSLTLLAPGVALAKIPGNPAGGVTPGGPGGAHAEILPKTIRDLESPRISPPSRRIYVPGARSLTWEASDPNKDTLIYSLFLRREGDSTWNLIEGQLEDGEYTLDGASFPDGVYYFRVVASDRESNPSNQALQGELVSKPFILANTIPAIDWQPAQLSGTKIRIRFAATTTVSPIYEAQYSLDGVHWHVVFPEDGIADSTSEMYSFELSDVSSQSKNIFVRVADTVGNLGTSMQALPAR